MELAKGAMILGRPCRTEMVKANRKSRHTSFSGAEQSPRVC